jgi:hypothetical protein
LTKKEAPFGATHTKEDITMRVILQESDLEIVNDKLQEIMELSRDVVKGGKDEIKAAFAISIKARKIQKYLEEHGALEAETCLAN